MISATEVYDTDTEEDADLNWELRDTAFRSIPSPEIVPTFL